MDVTRRSVIEAIAAAAPGAPLMQVSQAQTPSASGASVTLKWLDDQPPHTPTGISWGVPWARGTVRKDERFSLRDSVGVLLPLQSWPLAYWPDGSLKWSGFATVTDSSKGREFRLSRDPGASSGPSLKVTESSEAIQVDTGAMECRIRKSGAALIGSIRIEGREVARDGRLTCSLEDRSDWETNQTLRTRRFASSTASTAVEQAGPVRAVVKLQGVHKADAGDRSWLPWIVRLYFYAGETSIGVVHTVVFDGDDQTDFVNGLGVEFNVPFREESHNRHVRFSGEGDGLWSEPLQPATGRARLTLPGRSDLYAEQLAGKRLPNRAEFTAAGQKLLNDWAVWDSFKLVQPNADGFTIQKRAHADRCWVDAGAGKRSSGYAFVGDVSGGMGIAIRNFWQSYPASLEVRNATSEAAHLFAWLWSPDAPAMDLRHYDVKAHDLDSSYEDVQPGFSTPHGIARTSELMLYPTAAVLEKQVSAGHAKACQHPARLVCAPEYLHSVSAFGVWSLPDRSTQFKRMLEDQLDAAVNLYQKEIEQRHWYGFWNYGDIMHAYDSARHTWRYDIGGFAWDNTELASDMWLWLTYLRTGRGDLFRMAEAMTRHTSEVDTYHLGRFALLGSRHNVRHWGCGAKEARISQAASRRYYYYLTTDERTGDIMRHVLDVDLKVMEIDPMRLASPRKGPQKYPGRVRGGPDWLAFAGNWMTEWERTGDTRYRDKIIAGLDSIASMPYAFMSGPNSLFGYDPSTNKLYTLEEDPFGAYNLQVIMGGAELILEMIQIIDHPGWNKAWLQYCRLTNAPKDIVAQDMKTGTEGADARHAGAGRLAAYAYMKTRNPAFADKAIASLSGGSSGRRSSAEPYATRRVEPPDVLNPIDEAPFVSTNTAAQSSLNVIQVLEMCKDRLPESPAVKPA